MNRPDAYNGLPVLCKHLKRENIAGRPITLAILQTAAGVSVVRSLREVFASEFNCVEVFDAHYSPAIGLNMGPEATGIAYYKHPLRA